MTNLPTPLRWIGQLIGWACVAFSTLVAACLIVGTVGGVLYLAERAVAAPTQAIPDRLTDIHRPPRFAQAHRLIRQYLANPTVSHIRFLHCKPKAWEGSGATLCHTAWRQADVVFDQFGRPVPTDVDAYVWYRRWQARSQCSVAGVPWQKCRDARPF